jgi:hypothetical protein
VFSGNESEPSIPAATIQAYRETHYKVFSAPGSAEVALTLHVDQPCPELSQALADCGVSCSAYLTASDLFSEKVLPPGTNAKLQRLLANELTKLGLAFDEGVGQHADPGWPGEASFLVYGIDLRRAKQPGVAFQQNAFVWSDPDWVPRLVLLR